MPKYTYSVSTLPNGKVNPATLHRDIGQSSISSSILNVTVNDDSMDIEFDDALSPTDESTLDSIVASHEGDAEVRATGWTEPVLSIENDPPISPSRNDRYLIGDSPTGVWANHAKSIASYKDEWIYHDPIEGTKVWISNQAKYFYYDGSDWKLYCTSIQRIHLLKDTLTEDLNNGSDIAIRWDMQDYADSVFTHSTSSNPERITVTEAGLYRIWANVIAKGSNGRFEGKLEIRVDGSYVQGTRNVDYSRNDTIDEVGLQCLATLELDANQYIEIWGGRYDSETSNSFDTVIEDCLCTIERFSEEAVTNTWRPIHDTPVNGASTTSISSNWAYNHDHDSDYADISHNHTFESLSDVDAYTGNAGKFAKVKSSEDGIEFADTGGTGGVDEFTELTDTPSAYTGESGKIVVVNTGESGLVFQTPKQYWHPMFLYLEELSWDAYFYSWTVGDRNTIPSGSTDGIAWEEESSPIICPFSGTIVSSVFAAKGVGVSTGSPSYPVMVNLEIWSTGWSNEGTKLGDIEIEIASNVGNWWSVWEDTNAKVTTSHNISVSAGDLLSVKFNSIEGNSDAVAIMNAFIIFTVEGDVS